MISKTVGNALASSEDIFLQRKKSEGKERLGLVRFAGILAEINWISKVDRRTSENSKMWMLKDNFTTVRNEKQIIMSFDDIGDVGQWWVKGCYEMYACRFINGFNM